MTQIFNHIIAYTPPRVNFFEYLWKYPRDKNMKTFISRRAPTTSASSADSYQGCSSIVPSAKNRAGYLPSDSIKSNIASILPYCGYFQANHSHPSEIVSSDSAPAVSISAAYSSAAAFSSSAPITLFSSSMFSSSSSASASSSSSLCIAL